MNNFQMAEKSRRDTEISRREAEMSRADSIQIEMASAVRVLGGIGSAKEQVAKAARAARLSRTTIERLRWRKIKRIPADIADAVRDAVNSYNEESLTRARHETFIARQRASILAARLMEIDPDFYGPEIDRLRGRTAGPGRGADSLGGDGR